MGADPGLFRTDPGLENHFGAIQCTRRAEWGIVSTDKNEIKQRISPTLISLVVR